MMRNLRRSSLLITTLLLPLVASAAKGLNPVKVFILAGQSNMEGQAVADLDGKDGNDGKGTLLRLMSDPAKAAMFQRLKGANARWAVRDDVWARYQREQGPLLAVPTTSSLSTALSYRKWNRDSSNC